MVSKRTIGSSRKSKTPAAVQAAWIAGIFGFAAVLLTSLLSGRDRDSKLADKLHVEGGSSTVTVFVTPPLALGANELPVSREKSEVAHPSPDVEKIVHLPNPEESKPMDLPQPLDPPARPLGDVASDGTSPSLDAGPSTGGGTADTSRHAKSGPVELVVPGPARVSISAQTTGAIYGDYRGKIPKPGVPKLADGVQVQIRDMRSRRAEIIWSADGNSHTGWVDSNILRPLVSQTP